MRSAELKHLRCQGVDFFERTITIRRSKTELGYRTIPLNEDAFVTLLELRKVLHRKYDISQPVVRFLSLSKMLPGGDDAEGTKAAESTPQRLLPATN